MLTAFVISFCYIARLLFGASLEQEMTYWFFKPPSAANYNSEAFKLIKEYYVVSLVLVPIITNEIIRINLKVYESLDRNIV